MDPRAVATRWPEPRLRVLAELATTVTEAPWRLGPAVRTRAAEAGIDDDTLIHGVALSAFFGHLNRVADAVGMPLDYDVRYPAPHAVPSTPRYELAPAGTDANVGELALGRRPATAAALEVWRAYVLERDAPLPRAERDAIVARVNSHLGGPPGPAGEPLFAELADTVALAPWALGPEAFAPLRAGGADDALLFDVCTVASTANMLRRIAVALAALGR